MVIVQHKEWRSLAVFGVQKFQFGNAIITLTCHVCMQNKYVPAHHLKVPDLFCSKVIGNQTLLNVIFYRTGIKVPYICIENK